MTATTTTDLGQRRNELTDKLGWLRRQAGGAVLDGKVFDADAIAKVEREIDGLDEALAESVTRDRQKAAAQLAEQRKRLAGELRDANKRRLAAIEASEKHAKAMADALGDAQREAMECSRLCSALGRQTNGLGIEAEARLAARLAAVLWHVPRMTFSAQHRFGHDIRITRTPPTPQNCDPDAPWLDGEESVNKEIETIAAEAAATKE